MHRDIEDKCKLLWLVWQKASQKWQRGDTIYLGPWFQKVLVHHVRWGMVAQLGGAGGGCHIITENQWPEVAKYKTNSRNLYAATCLLQISSTYWSSTDSWELSFQSINLWWMFQIMSSPAGNTLTLAHNSLQRTKWPWPRCPRPPVTIFLRHHDFNIWQKHLKGGVTCFGSWFQRVWVYHVGEGKSRSLASGILEISKGWEGTRPCTDPLNPCHLSANTGSGVVTHSAVPKAMIASWG